MGVADALRLPDIPNSWSGRPRRGPAPGSPAPRPTPAASRPGRSWEVSRGGVALAQDRFRGHDLATRATPCCRRPLGKYPRPIHTCERPNSSTGAWRCTSKHTSPPHRGTPPSPALRWTSRAAWRVLLAPVSALALCASCGKARGGRSSRRGGSARTRHLLPSHRLRLRAQAPTPPPLLADLRGCLGRMEATGSGADYGGARGGLGCDGPGACACGPSCARAARLVQVSPQDSLSIELVRLSGHA